MIHTKVSVINDFMRAEHCIEHKTVIHLDSFIVQKVHLCKYLFDIPAVLGVGQSCYVRFRAWGKMSQEQDLIKDPRNKTAA